MISNRYKSLEQYAHRRFVLSGTSVVKDHFPYCRPMEEVGATLRTSHPSPVSFAHYDYLDLAADERVRQAAQDAIAAYGVGVGSSRLVGGELSLHRDLEREMSEFLGVEDTLALVSGYGTNVALVSHLLTKGDLILVDESAHNSIMVGTQLSRAETISFRHNDLNHLNALLAQCRGQFGRALVVVEGLYSMDGDIPDLPGLLTLCRRHGAWLLVDEAHSIGVLGATGRGLAEHFGIPISEIDLVVGTLSKAFVACGGFISGKRSIIEWLRFTLPGFVYSVGLPPPLVAGVRTALRILQEEPDRLRRLKENSKYFANGARERGLNIGTASGVAVIPILFPDTPTAMSAAKAALAAGYFVPPIVQIAVPKDTPRMRFFVTAGHNVSQIDGVLNVLSPFAVERPPALVEGQVNAFGSFDAPAEVGERNASSA